MPALFLPKSGPKRAIFNSFTNFFQNYGINVFLIKMDYLYTVLSTIILSLSKIKLFTILWT